jgi:hypothetical protein
MGTIAITIEIDDSRLTSYSDSHLAALWHVAQANPAPLEDRDAGELAERIGREIIRRWLSATQPELYRHQGQHQYWFELTKLGKWNADRVFVPDPAAAESGAGDEAASAS